MNLTDAINRARANRYTWGGEWMVVELPYLSPNTGKPMLVICPEGASTEQDGAIMFRTSEEPDVRRG